MPISTVPKSMTSGAIGSVSLIGIYAVVAAGAEFVADGSLNYRYVDTVGNGAPVAIPNGQTWRNLSQVAATAAGCYLLCVRVY